MRIRELLTMINPANVAAIHAYRTPKLNNAQHYLTRYFRDVIREILESEPISSDYVVLGIGGIKGEALVFTVDKVYLAACYKVAKSYTEIPEEDCLNFEKYKEMHSIAPPRTLDLSQAPWGLIAELEVFLPNVFEIGIDAFLEDLFYWITDLCHSDSQNATEGMDNADYNDLHRRYLHINLDQVHPTLLNYFTDCDW